MRNHQFEAERLLVGACLVGGRAAVDDVVDVDVRPRDLSTPALQAAWGAVLALHERGAEVSAISVAEFLDSQKILATIGGAAELATLQAAAVGGALGLREAAGVVVEGAALRRIAEAASLIARGAIERDADAATLLQRAQEIFWKLNRRASRVTYADRPAVVRKILEEAGKGTERGIPTGWSALDSGLLSGGLRPGQLIIVAARPSMGKSALAQQLATYTADHTAAAALFSLEMSPEELVGRELVQASRVRQSDFRRALGGSALTQAQATVSERALYLYDCPSATLGFISSTLRRAVQYQGVGLAVIDYLQLMRSDVAKDQNKADAVGEITGGLKILARELRIPIVLLSQLNRAVEQRPDKRPMMSDLRDSGTIEQDADTVLMLYRPAYYLREKCPPDQENLCEVLVVKNRGGPTGKAGLFFDSETMRFVDSETMGDP
jgi:replicative DNA helicase